MLLREPVTVIIWQLQGCVVLQSLKLARAWTVTKTLKIEFQVFLNMEQVTTISYWLQGCVVLESVLSAGEQFPLAIFLWQINDDTV